jgi:chromosome segregation ATPase
VTRLESEKVRLESDLNRLENEFRQLKEQFQMSREEKRKLSKEVVQKTSRLATLENQVCSTRFKLSCLSQTNRNIAI